jgi:hypothetical protein
LILNTGIFPVILINKRGGGYPAGTEAAKRMKVNIYVYIPLLKKMKKMIIIIIILGNWFPQDDEHSPPYHHQ